MFISPAFAQAAADGAGSTMNLILPLLMMLPVFGQSQSQTQNQVPVVNSASIEKIDAKKMTLKVKSNPNDVNSSDTNAPWMRTG